jgi:hypothetical protein
MKLFPLFQTLRDKAWCHVSTLEHVQRELPREAIEAAIPLLIKYGLELSYGKYDHSPNTEGRRRAELLVEANNKHIEQLRAMLPEEE